MSTKPITENTLFYGDNLDILRQYIPDESVDLIYLDPPFNSNRAYSVFFKDEKGTESQAQITAFEDTWRWDKSAEDTYLHLVTQSPERIGTLIEAMRKFIGSNQMMAYLVMMTVRLVELHRVLKSTGSLYLHCDPTASHYLKIVLDTLFGMKNYRNEIVWHYGGRGATLATQFSRDHDILLFYSKTYGRQQFFQQYIKRLYSLDEAKKQGFRKDDEGRWFKTAPRGGYTDESIKRLASEGRIYQTRTGGIRIKYFLKQDGIHIVEDALVGDVWHDVPDAMHMGRERLGYPTQKPLALLERIISASSNPGDVILDPFCGCGTSIAAAQKLDRQWIGIDITHLAIALQKYRLEAMYPNIKFKVIGEPIDISAARQLASENRYQFQWWALSLIRAKPLGGQQGSREGKKGSDKGIDGVIAFIDDSTQKAKRALVQVKSGHVSSRDIRDLVGTLQRESAAIGVFITLEEPTRDMKTEAISAGYYSSQGWHKDYPRIQILTIDELLHGASVQMPKQFGTFKEAQKVQTTEEVEQTRFA